MKNNFYLMFCIRVIALVINVGWVTLANASPWDGLTGIPLTPLGNKVAVSCHNCYNGLNNKIYTLAEANNKVNAAIGRGTNIIEIDVGITGLSQQICASHEGSAACTKGEPLFADMLANTTFRDSNALVFLELKNITIDNNLFATRLLDTIKANPAYATSQRPFYIRGFREKITLLKAIQNKLNNSAYSNIRHHIRFSVAYIRTRWDDLGSINNLQNHIRDNVYANGFDFVEVNFKMKDLLGVTRYAKSLGLGVGLFTIPSSHGDAFTAALREEVDQLTVEYRVDYARETIQRANSLAYLNTANCNSANDSTVTYRFNHIGGQGNVAELVNIPATSSQYGTPGLWYDAKGQDRFGCSLDFRSNQGYSYRTLPMGDRDNGTGEGFLVTAFVNFDKLSSLPEGVMAIVNKSQSGGFAIELKQSGTNVLLRFGAHINGAYRYHSYNVNSTGLASPNNSLNGSDGYFLVGAYDGDGGLYLWIDNQKVGNGGTYTGTVTANNVDMMVGADPQPSATRKARFFFNGLIQQVSVLRWNAHPQGAN